MSVRQWLAEQLFNTPFLHQGAYSWASKINRLWDRAREIQGLWNWKTKSSNCLITRELSKLYGADFLKKLPVEIGIKNDHTRSKHALTICTIRWRWSQICNAISSGRLRSTRYRQCIEHAVEKFKIDIPRWVWIAQLESQFQFLFKSVFIGLLMKKPSLIVP